MSSEQKKETAVGQLLLTMESLFTWEFPREEMDEPHDQFIRTLEKKCVGDTEDDLEFKWNSFTMHLLLAHEFCAIIKDYAKAEEHIKFCVDHLESLAKQKCTEVLFTSIHAALCHVLLATKAHVLLKKGVTDNIKRIATEVKPLNKMTQEEKAGIHGLKAAVYIWYGREGHRLAVEQARIASKLDPRQAEWSFLEGKALGRLQRAEHRCLTDEEVDAFLKAYNLQKNASYTVYFAQLFHEYADHVSCNSMNQRNDILKSRKSLEYYRKSLEYRIMCASAKARVGHGWIRVEDRQVMDIPFIKQLLDNLIESTPNNSMDNTEKPIFNLEKANELGNSKALLHMTTVKWSNQLQDKINSDFQRAFDRASERAIQRFLKKNRFVDIRAEVLMILGARTLIGDDWTTGVKHLIESLQLDPSGKFFLTTIERKNLLASVTDELRLKIAVVGKIPEPAFQAFLDLAKTVNPRLFDYPPKHGAFETWRRDQLMESFRKL